MNEKTKPVKVIMPPPIAVSSDVADEVEIWVSQALAPYAASSSAPIRHWRR